MALDLHLSRVRTGVAAMGQDCNYQLGRKRGKRYKSVNIAGFPHVSENHPLRPHLGNKCPHPHQNIIRQWRFKSRLLFSQNPNILHNIFLFYVNMHELLNKCQ
jgi:hypothetical protein